MNRSDIPPTPEPRAAYVHVPFCRHRCGYCNFTVLAGRDDLIEDYLRAIEIELSGLGVPREVDTLFFGGGTPSHLPVHQLRSLLEVTRSWFVLKEGHEFSIEANPIDVTRDLVSLLAEFGVNRVSLGVQSFDAGKLQFLERDHDGAIVHRSVDLVRAKVQSVAIDLIFGVPDETLDLWQADLARALAIEVDHVSTYGLTYEKGTTLWGRWHRGQVTPIDEERERSMFELSIDKLTQSGFEHYEVSNFARPGHRCRHNEAYWGGRSYFAAGPGAARYIGGRREINHRGTTTYLKRVLAGLSPVGESESLGPEDRASEALVIGLRRIRGVNRAQFASETGFALVDLLGGELQRFLVGGLMEWNGDWLRLTREGLLVSDSLWPRLLRV